MPGRKSKGVKRQSKTRKQSPGKKVVKKSISASIVSANTKKHTLLKECERQLKIVLDAAHMGIWEWDLRTNHVNWTGSFFQIFKLDRNSFSDSFESYLKMVHPEDHNLLVDGLQKSLKDSAVHQVEYRVILEDGTVRWVESIGNIKRNKKGTPVRMAGIIQDITQKKAAEKERIRTEERLRDSEQRFRTLHQASFGGIGLHDQGMIIDCNQGLCDVTGYSYQELIGSNGLNLIAPEWKDFVFEKIQTGYEKPYDAEGIRKNGTRYFVEIHGKNIPHESRTIRVTEFRDISDRKRNEEKFIEQNVRLLAVTEDLRRKNNQLEEFTQIVSHNLRSPVGNILTLLNFYDGAKSDEERTEYIALIKEAGATTLTMLNELNDILKIKQTKNIPKQELKFENVLQQIRSMVNARITELSGCITADFSEAPVIHYPAIYMESILLNLLDNALKYRSPERQPVITIRTYYNENRSVLMEVKDNGLGINLGRYGHQVFKLRKTFHHHPESRGVGLFMIKNQIEAMGGEITISSKENEGSTFFINFNKHPTDGP